MSTNDLLAQIIAGGPPSTGDMPAILAAPIGFQLHVLAAWTLFAFWPFSRLVHVFSAPIGYLTRPYIVYRSRDDQLGSTRPRRGWENVR